MLDRLDMEELPFSDYLGRARPGRLADAGRPSEYFGSPDWFRLLAETCLGDGEAPVVHRLPDAGGEPLLDLPLVRSRLSAYGLRGQQIQGLANYYSRRYRPPGLPPGAPDERLAEALGRWARALPWLGPAPDRILFRALDERDGAAAPLQAALRDAGYRTERFPDYGNWYLPCAGLSVEDYWRGRPGSLRSTVRRKLKALEREHVVRVRRFERAEEAAQALSCYRSVQARAWQPDEPHPAFLPALIGRGLSAGTLWLWVLEADDRPIAAQIWTLGADTATIFKLAYDAAWKRWSPGTLLTEQALRCALDSGAFKEIDFGRGDDAYKRQWMTRRSQCWGLAGYRARTALGTVLALRHLGARRLRSVTDLLQRPVN